MPWLIATACYLAAGLMFAARLLPALNYLEIPWPVSLPFLAVVALLWPLLVVIQIVKFLRPVPTWRSK